MAPKFFVVGNPMPLLTNPKIKQIRHVSKYVSFPTNKGPALTAVWCKALSLATSSSLR